MKLTDCKDMALINIYSIDVICEESILDKSICIIFWHLLNKNLVDVNCVLSTIFTVLSSWFNNLFSTKGNSSKLLI